MSVPSTIVSIYQDDSLMYLWLVKTQDGEVLARSGQSYGSQATAKRRFIAMWRHLLNIYSWMENPNRIKRTTTFMPYTTNEQAATKPRFEIEVYGGLGQYRWRMHDQGMTVARYGREYTELATASNAAFDFWSHLADVPYWANQPSPPNGGILLVFSSSS